MSVARLAALALGVLAAACAPEERDLIVVLHDEVDSDAVRIEAFVFRAGETVTCSDLLGETETLEFPDAELQTAFSRDAPTGLGYVGDGNHLVLVRAWSDDCRLAQACQQFTVSEDYTSDVRVDVAGFISSEPACPSTSVCDMGECLFCDECCFDWDCNDHLPLTTDVCVEGICQTALDYDHDGLPLPSDCDDRRADVSPLLDPSCGDALDVDCDGMVDDLDGCSPPACWLGSIIESDRRSELRAQAVVAYGAFVVAAVYDSQQGTSVWLGSLQSGTLFNVGSVHLDGTEGGSRPQDLVLYGSTAFVVTGDPSHLYLVDISVPGDPRQLESVDLDPRPTQSATVAPPLLWLARASGLDVLDISQIGMSGSWPDIVTEGLEPGFSLVYHQVSVRFGTAFVMGGTTRVFCADLESSVDLPAPEAFVPCFDAGTFGVNTHASFGLGHITPDRQLFLASATGGSEPEVTPPLLWQFALDDNNRPSPEGVRYAEVLADPEDLAIVGGSIFRSTVDGLYIHSKDSFDNPTGNSWAHFDVDGDSEVYGPPVYETALIGTSAVLAAGDAGMMVLSLSCR